MRVVILLKLTFLKTANEGCVRWLIRRHLTFGQQKIRHDEPHLSLVRVGIIWNLRVKICSNYVQFSVSLFANVWKSFKMNPSSTKLVRQLNNIKFGIHRDDKKETRRNETSTSLICLDGLQLSAAYKHCGWHQQMSGWEKFSMLSHILYKTEKATQWCTREVPSPTQ